MNDERMAAQDRLRDEDRAALRRLIATFPPLTPEQRQYLAALLRPAVGDPLLTAAEAAAHCGLATATWRYYKRVGLVPAPDDPGDESVPPNRRTPRWRRSTVEHFKTHRIGRGKRSRPVDEA